MHRSSADAAKQYRYFLATRRAFCTATTVALASEGARFSGRERLITAAMNLDTSICAWAPPQAISNLERNP